MSLLKNAIFIITSYNGAPLRKKLYYDIKLLTYVVIKY